MIDLGDFLCGTAHEEERDEEEGGHGQHGDGEARDGLQGQAGLLHDDPAHQHPHRDSWQIHSTWEPREAQWTAPKDAHRCPPRESFHTSPDIVTQMAGAVISYSLERKRKPKWNVWGKMTPKPTSLFGKGPQCPLKEFNRLFHSPSRVHKNGLIQPPLYIMTWIIYLLPSSTSSRLNVSHHGFCSSTSIVNILHLPTSRLL